MACVTRHIGAQKEHPDDSAKEWLFARPRWESDIGLFKPQKRAAKPFTTGVKMSLKMDLL